MDNNKFSFEQVKPSTDIVMVDPFEGVTGAGDVFVDSVVETSKKEVAELNQRTFDWHLKRMFRFTGSQIDNLLSAGRADKKRGITAGHPLTIWGKTALSVIREKKTLWTMTDEGRADYVLQQMQKDFYPTRWGNDNEPIARKAYCEKTGYKVKETGFSVNAKCDYHGGSFDGEVVKNGKTIGIIEIKCPYDPIKHDLNLDLMTDIDNMRLESGDDRWFDVHHDYYGQIQSNIETAGVDWCDFVSFDPRQSDKYKLAIIRVYRDEIYCENMMDRVHKAKKIFDMAINGMSINQACVEVEQLQ
jgi:hypothetical protein